MTRVHFVAPLVVPMILLLLFLHSHADPRTRPSSSQGSERAAPCERGASDQELERFGGHDNEPRTFRPVACLDWTIDEGSSIATSPLRRVADSGWIFSSEPHLRVVWDTDDDGGRERVGQAHFPSGWAGGRSPVWAERNISEAEFTKLYVSFRIKVSANWQGHPVNDKLIYVWVHGKPVVFPVYVGGGQNTLTTEVRLQDLPGPGRNLTPNLEGLRIVRDEWHQWELLLVSNTPGLPDGKVSWWVDGRPIGEYTGVRFNGIDETDTWEVVSWRPIWGGAGGIVREDQYMWIDDLYVSGSP